MDAFGYGYWTLSALTGWLAWRGTHNWTRALTAASFAPLLALIAFGALVARAELKAMPPSWVFAGMVATLAVLVWLHR